MSTYFLTKIFNETIRKPTVIHIRKQNFTLLQSKIFCIYFFRYLFSICHCANFFDSIILSGRLVKQDSHYRTKTKNRYFYLLIPHCISARFFLTFSILFLVYSPCTEKSRINITALKCERKFCLLAEQAIFLSRLRRVMFEVGRLLNSPLASVGARIYI